MAGAIVGPGFPRAADGHASDIHVTRRFPRDVPEIPRSRRFVADVLRSNGAAANEAALLVASELVTNAVQHGTGEVELRIDLDGLDLRLEVLDDGHAAVPVPFPSPSARAVGGRGLHLVRSVSQRWGAGFDAAGRTLVWAELVAARA
jgi:serine/threonine-protein kinase RsbW